MSMAVIPIPTPPVSFRLATRDDIPFMDALQKKYGRALGYFRTQQFEGYVDMGAVVVAEGDERNFELGTMNDESGDPHSPPFTVHRSSFSVSPTPLGYIISRDRYLKRDELGVIYQLCVTPGQQRKFVGAALVQEAFRRSAYGCRLYCLWCAQDLEANHFWESMGFVPLAFRAGSDRKKRVHIFWQKRICEGDEGPTATKWWYPFQTNGGAIRADRIVFPIPQGVHWKDVQAVNVPRDETAKLEGPKAKPGQATKRQLQPARPTKGPRPMGGFRFQSESPEPVKTSRKTRLALTQSANGSTGKIDPKYLIAARELRDRYLEHVNADAMLLASDGKYDLARALPERRETSRLLPAA